MSTMQQSFDAVLLADAAYLNLSGLERGQILTGPALRSKLTEEARLTSAQADYIVVHFDLVAFTSDAGSSFEAAVFKDKRVSDGKPGQYVLAIRGSQEIFRAGADI